MGSSHSWRSSKVADLLASEIEPITFVPNPGNAGDALINLGTYHLLQALGIEWSTIPAHALPQLPAHDLIVLGGGGGLVPEWDGTAAHVAWAIERARRVVLLPQTVAGHDETLRSLRPEDVLFVRELSSYEYCRRLGLKCLVELDHDVALNVDLSRLEARMRLRDVFDHAPPWRRLSWLRLAQVTKHRILGGGLRELEAFRIDAESLQTGRRRTWMNDVSLTGTVHSGSLDESETVSARFLALIDRYGRVATDRLHVTIGAVLLGKKVTAYDNINGKVSGVVNYSRLPVDLKEPRKPSGDGSDALS